MTGIAVSDEMTARANVFSGLGSTGVHNHPLIKLSRKTCLKCSGGANVLVCKHGDCPIVVHENCLFTAARFDDNGNFCCPYCFYKQSLVECHQAKEKAMLAKKAVSICLDMKMTVHTTGNPQNSKGLKRKEPDSPTYVNSKNAGSGSKVETDETVCQPMQIECDHKDEHSELMTHAGDQQEAGLPLSSHCFEKATAAEEYENLSKEPQETIQMVGIDHNESLGIELTQAEQGTSVCLTRMDDTIDIYEESDKGNESTFQDEYALRSQMDLKSKNTEQPAGVGDHCGRSEERKMQVISPISAIHPIEDNAFVAHLELGSLAEKHQETAKNDDGGLGGVEKQHEQAEDQNTSACLMKNNDTTEIHAEFDDGKDKTFEDSYFTRTQVTEISENPDQAGNVGEDDCRKENKGETLVNSLINVVHTVMKDAASVIHEESGNLIEKCQKIAETVERCGGVGKKLIQAEPHDPSICLTGKDNTMETHEESDEGNDSEFQDDSFVRSPMIVNPKSADQPAETGEDCSGRTDEEETQTKPLENAVNSTRKDNDYVTREDSENSTEKSQETAKDVEGYGGISSQQMQADLQETSFSLAREGSTNKEHQMPDKENDSTFQDDCFVRNQKAVDSENIDAEIGSDDCGRTNEKQRQAKLLESDINSIMDSVEVTDEECEDGDNGASSQDGYNTGDGIDSNWESELPENPNSDNQLGESSESSGTDFSELEESEEYEEVTRGKSRQKMDPAHRIQHPALPIARRKKLPWTVEEVEILEEGVQRFSLITNKNLPWMKILEFGRHIFDGTRTPVDLKDKWKNLTAKGQATSNLK